MAKKKRTTVKKAKKKTWVNVIAPKIFNGASLGESLVTEAKELENKTVLTSLANITNDLRSQNINIKFRINEIKTNTEVITEAIGYYMIPASLKRLIRRKRNKLDESFVVFTKDKIKVRVKPLVITRNLIPSSVERELRSRIRSYTIVHFGENNFDDLFKEIFQTRFQKSMSKCLKAIVPIRSVEVKTLEVITKGRALKLTKEMKTFYDSFKIVKPKPKKVEAKTEETKEE